MLFGDIPYSEAWHIDEIKEPKFDTQKEVLDALEGLLDEALGQIDESDPNTISKYDLYYGGDMAKWRKLAKSIKLKIYMYLSNKEDVSAKIKALIEEGDLLSSSADDCKFPFYDSPGNRNPNAEFDNQNPGYLGWMYFGHAGDRRSDECYRRPAPSFLLLCQRGGQVCGHRINT